MGVFRLREGGQKGHEIRKNSSFVWVVNYIPKMSMKSLINITLLLVFGQPHRKRHTHYKNDRKRH